jgi:glutamyl-tRNA reductase
VPRDIDASVAGLEDVYLYTIDDLRSIIDVNLRSRRAAALEAEALIDLQVTHYLDWRRALVASNPLAGLRRDAEGQRDEVLAKARALLAGGRTPEQALEFLAHTLTNKLLHAPSANLRAAAQRGDADLLRAAERLFDAEAGAKPKPGEDA